MKIYVGQREQNNLTPEEQKLSPIQDSIQSEMINLSPGQGFVSFKNGPVDLNASFCVITHRSVINNSDAIKPLLNKKLD